MWNSIRIVTAVFVKSRFLNFSTTFGVVVNVVVSVTVYDTMLGAIVKYCMFILLDKDERCNN